MKHLLLPIATCVIGFLIGFYLAKKIHENTPSWLYMVRGKAVTIDSQTDDGFTCTFELTRHVAFTDRPFHKVHSLEPLQLHSILNRMIYTEKNPPNTTISFESNDPTKDDTHDVVEIINIEKPDIKNPNKITLACKFLTNHDIPYLDKYSNVDLTIDSDSWQITEYNNEGTWAQIYTSIRESSENPTFLSGVLSGTYGS